MTPLDLIYLAAAGLTAPRWRRKNRGGWPERFGKGEPLPPTTNHASKPRILLHGVSVGETSALRPIVPLLQDQGLDVVVSATTDTGLARARSLYAGVCPVVRYPLDASWAVRRFLDRVQPDAVALFELELWPQFVKACARRGIPVAVINGRLSARSFKGYRRLRFAIGPSFRRLAFAAVQDEAYAGRFREMGVARVEVTGSMKWDAVPMHAAGVSSKAADLADALGLDRDRPLIVGASTAEGEEALLHKACPPDAQLLCAPRHPERFAEAASALPHCRRRSDPAAGVASSDRFLLDTIGELSLAYELADLVVIGRSFGTLHGSDVGEPAGLGVAMLAGPRMGDFAIMADALEAAGAMRRTSAASLTGDVAELTADDAKRAQMGEAARRCVAEHRGASARNAALLGDLLHDRGNTRTARDRA